MLKSHIYILQYLQERDLPVHSRMNLLPFWEKKYLVCFCHAQERTKQKHIFW